MIEESPYILEKMVEEQKEFNSVKLSSILLTTIFKLFFKRAPEVQKMLGRMAGWMYILHLSFVRKSS